MQEDQKSLVLAGEIVAALLFVASFGAWSGYHSSLPSEAHDSCQSMDIFCLAEKHAGLGGWVGAIGALLAIRITWYIASAQTSADRNARKRQHQQYVDLISSVLEDVENLLEPFLASARNGYSKGLEAWQNDMLNAPAMKAGIDFAFVPIRDWPSVDSYKHFKVYWYNTVEVLRIAATPARNPSFGPDDINRVSNEVVDRMKVRDEALWQLRTALRAARMFVI